MILCCNQLLDDCFIAFNIASLLSKKEYPYINAVAETNFNVIFNGANNSIIMH